MNPRIVALIVLLILGGMFPALTASDDSELEVDKLFSTHEIMVVLAHYEFTRDLKQWHIHHTWDPSYADFSWSNHLALQLEMRDLHTLQNGWDDIGQHLTLFPDGQWMLGRCLNKDPASIRGWNRGALAVEMVGNFDVGEDLMTPMQQDAIVEMTRFVVKQFGLEIAFHRDHPKAGKTCPGSAFKKPEFLKLVFPESLESVGKSSGRLTDR